MSHKKNTWLSPAHPNLLLVWHWICCLHRLYFAVGVIPKEGFAGLVLANPCFGKTMTMIQRHVKHNWKGAKTSLPYCPKPPCGTCFSLLFSITWLICFRNFLFTWSKGTRINDLGGGLTKSRKKNFEGLPPGNNKFQRPFPKKKWISKALLQEKQSQRPFSKKNNFQKAFSRKKKFGQVLLWEKKKFKLFFIGF